MKGSKGFLLLVMMLLGLFCLSSPSWAEAACPEGEPQQSYTGSLLIAAKDVSLYESIFPEKDIFFLE